MRLAVFSHKPCWPDPSAPGGFATDGGFPFQMRYLSDLFDSTLLVVPVRPHRPGGTPLQGAGLTLLPLSMPKGYGIARKLALVPWFILNMRALLQAARSADVIHAPIPGDIGTVGMLLAVLTRKRLFVRHCGNWFVQRTPAEHFWRWFMVRFAGQRNVMMATGGAAEPPSAANPAVTWIFSSSLSQMQLEAFPPKAPITPGRPLQLITVARQEPGKGTDVVIRSLALIENAFLHVVGNGSALDGLRALAQTLKVQNRVFFHGNQPHDDVLLLLKSADLFCYPTASEGFPKAVLEALACGLPVISTGVSVLPLLIDGAGIILKAPTPEAVAEAVVRCVADGDKYRSMCEAARENARKYSLERWRDCIGERLQNVWGPLRSDVRDAAA